MAFEKMDMNNERLRLVQENADLRAENEAAGRMLDNLSAERLRQTQRAEKAEVRVAVLEEYRRLLTAAGGLLYIVIKEDTNLDMNHPDVIAWDVVEKHIKEERAALTAKGEEK